MKKIFLFIAVMFMLVVIGCGGIAQAWTNTPLCSVGNLNTSGCTCVQQWTPNCPAGGYVYMTQGAFAGYCYTSAVNPPWCPSNGTYNGSGGCLTYTTGCSMGTLTGTPAMCEISNQANLYCSPSYGSLDTQSCNCIFGDYYSDVRLCNTGNHPCSEPFDDTCDGNMYEEYTCGPSENRSCVDWVYYDSWSDWEEGDVRNVTCVP